MFFIKYIDVLTDIVSIRLYDLRNVRMLILMKIDNLILKIENCISCLVKYLNVMW